MSVSGWYVNFISRSFEGFEKTVRCDMIAGGNFRCSRATFCLDNAILIAIRTVFVSINYSPNSAIEASTPCR